MAYVQSFHAAQAARRVVFWLVVVATANLVPSIVSQVSAQSAAAPQVTSADYARAESVTPAKVVGKLKNGMIYAHWIGQRDELWYRRDTPTGEQFVMADAATGRVHPAFDHAALAHALSQASGASVNADSLPVERLMFGATRGSGADSADATVRGKAFVCRITPAPVCATAERPEGVVISPNARWGVVGRNNNLWLRDMKSGEEHALTTDGETNNGYGISFMSFKSIPAERALAAGHHLPPSGVSWSPDSRTVIATRIDQRDVADYPLLETVPVDGSFRPKVHFVKLPLIGEKMPAIRMGAIDVATSAMHWIDLPTDSTSWSVIGTSWSPDNRHLYVVAQRDYSSTSALFDVDIATSNARKVIEEHLTPHADLTSSLYNAPNVLVTRDGKHAIWWSQRDGWGHLYLYDFATGKLENQITKGNWLVRDLVDVDEPHRRIYFTAGGREPGNPYYRYLYRVNYDGTGLTLLSPEHADHVIGKQSRNEYFSVTETDVVSPSGKYVVYNYSTPSQPTQTVIRSTADDRLIATVEKADASTLLAAGFIPPEEFQAKAADGSTALWGVMYKPRNFDPTKHYPVIDGEYTSPVTTIVPRDFVTAPSPGLVQGGARSLAELGFIVVLIDARGTPYRSRAFGDASYARLDLMGLDDHVAVIKELGRRFPYVDTTRVGIVGVSFGGWGALRGMLGFPDFYKVGVAESPPGSMHGLYPSFDPLQGPPVYSNGSHLRPTPTEVAKNWQSVDNRSQAGKLKGHLLITVSELDENVPPGSTLQFVDALMKANKDFDLMYFPDTPHGMGKFNAYGTRRIWDYFVENLMGAKVPAYH